MKICYIAPVPSPSRKFGADKAILDAVEALRANGAHCDLYPDSFSRQKQTEYLQQTETTFSSDSAHDVVVLSDTVDCVINLPRPDQILIRFSPLLEHHFEQIHFPEIPTTFKSKLKQLLLGSRLRKKHVSALKARIQHKTRLLQNSDYVSVQNSLDKNRLIESGFAESKILVIPCGIGNQRLRELQEVTHTESTQPRLIFVGTFDFRKGCLDLVKIFEKVCSRYPQATLTLLGTKGLIPNEKGVRSFFKKSVQQQLTVIPRFEETQLPELMKNHDVGLFPSYIEGFGIGVVEMLAAGIPVVAYQAPGPCDILPEDDLIATGDTEGMATRALKKFEKMTPTLRSNSKEISRGFDWNIVAKKTLQAYQQAFASHQTAIQ